MAGAIQRSRCMYAPCKALAYQRALVKVIPHGPEDKMCLDTMDVPRAPSQQQVQLLTCSDHISFLNMTCELTFRLGLLVKL